MNLAKPKVTQVVIASLLVALLQTFALPQQVQAAGTSGSIQFDLTGTPSAPTNRQYVRVPGVTSITSDFTYELWVKFKTLGAGGFQSFLGQYGGTGQWFLQQMDTTKKFRLYSQYGELSPGVNLVENSWYHIALVRYSNNINLYVNGETATATPLVRSGTWGNSTEFTVGGVGTGGDRFNGSISNVRYVNRAIYTSSFSPPTSQLTAISGTLLLLNTTNDANYLNDDSTVPASLTIAYDTPTASAASPFMSLSSISDTVTVGTAITSYTLTNPNSAETYTATVVGGGTFSSPTNGISFNSTTGLFSGTPESATATISYRVAGATSKAAAIYSLKVASGQTITFPSLGNITLGGIAPTLAATASSGLTLSYASTTTGVCTVSGSSITVLTGGTCSITASQAGDATYGAAANVSKSFTITAPAVTNTYVQTPAPAPTKTQPPMVLTADKSTLGWNEVTPIKLTGGVDSGTVTYLNSGDTLCIVDVASSSLVTTTPGTCIMTAVNSGDFEYIWERSNEITINVVADLPAVRVITKKSTIYCVKGKTTKKVTGTKPKCPVGYKKRS